MNWDDPGWEEAASEHRADRERLGRRQYRKNDGGGDGPSKATPHIRLVAFNDIKLGTARRYLVKGIIPRVGLTVVWGPPKCGKSFWTFDLMMHAPLGWDYRGRRVDPGATVYCAFEGQAGMEARAEAFRQRFLQDHSGEVPFYLVPVTLNLVRDHKALIAAIRAELGPLDMPVAVTLDTLNRSIGGPENDEFMTAYVNAADAIRAAFDCAVIIVHHCGVDGTRPRGHSSLTGAVEAQLAVTRDAAGNVVVTVEYMKDGPEGATVVSHLEAVEVGNDEDGEPITSCVVVPVEGDALKAQPARRKLSNKNENAISTLADLVADQGKPLPSSWGLPADIRAVPVESYRKMLVSRGDISDDRRRFWDRKDELKAKKLVAERDGVIWLARNQ
jgi:hypothetical protein